jgi:hypothetical protein
MLVRRLLAISFSFLLFAGTAAVAYASPSEEAEFVSLINQSRAAAGLSALSVQNDLVSGARTHTGRMIPTDSIFHSTSAQLSAVTTGWAVLGENVGRGPSVAVLHKAFMESPSHKANILGDFDRVGSGVGHDANGKIYVTVIFMKTAAASTTTTTAPTPTTTTTAVQGTPAPAPTTTTTPTTVVVLTETALAPAPPTSAPTVPVDEPRTLGFELLSLQRFHPGTYCIASRPEGAICVE